MRPLRPRALTLRWLITVPVAAAVTAAGCSDHRTDSRRLLADGRRIFVSAGCGSCHTLASVGAHGTVGPDFDTSEQLDRGQIRRQLNEGVGGMPSFRARLTPREEDAVTEFVFQTLHRRR
jgi:mono/diheme cytochrome c family protein